MNNTEFPKYDPNMTRIIRYPLFRTLDTHLVVQKPQFYYQALIVIVTRGTGLKWIGSEYSLYSWGANHRKSQKNKNKMNQTLTIPSPDVVHHQPRVNQRDRCRLAVGGQRLHPLEDYWLEWLPSPVLGETRLTEIVWKRRGANLHQWGN